jgi:hypothetical protein
MVMEQPDPLTHGFSDLSPLGADLEQSLRPLQTDARRSVVAPPNEEYLDSSVKNNCTV